MMKIISHRGNLYGPDLDKENLPTQIDRAVKEGFEVEVDIWSENQKFFLGHDKPEFNIDFLWLSERAKNLWLHCKNIESIDRLLPNKGLKFFFHQNDDLTLTSNNILWVFPKKPYTKNSIIVSNDLKDISAGEDLPYGICTDFPVEFKKYLY